MTDRRDVYGSVLIVLVGLISFYLGRIGAAEALRPTVSIQTPPLPDLTISKGEGEPVGSGEAPKAAASDRYVASKSGSKYHLADCPGARTISEANKVWFSSKEEAEKAGYAPAANCPGM